MDRSVIVRVANGCTRDLFVFATTNPALRRPPHEILHVNRNLLRDYTRVASGDYEAIPVGDFGPVNTKQSIPIYFRFYYFDENKRRPHWMNCSEFSVRKDESVVVDLDGFLWKSRRSSIWMDEDGFDHKKRWRDEHRASFPPISPSISSQISTNGSQ